MRYPDLKDNEWFIPVRKAYRMACCDCGLVHEIDFKLVPHKSGKGIMIRARRHNRATAAVRRGMRDGRAKQEQEARTKTPKKLRSKDTKRR